MIPTPDASPEKAKRGALQIALATLVFALWHSLFCAAPTKARLLPVLQKRGLTYRAFFQIQSFLTVPLLFWFVMTRPARVIYQISGALKAIFWGLQAASAAIFVTCFFVLHPFRFLLGRGQVEPEGQGPDLQDEGKIEVRGPFQYSRHAAEWAAMGILCFTPLLKSNWAIFNVLGLVYTAIGAWHEEKRLEKRGGEAYKKYQREVGFFVGRKKSGEQKSD